MPIVPNVYRGDDGEFHVDPKARPIEGEVCSPGYDLLEEIKRFPDSSPEEVQKWADSWFHWAAQRNRIELTCGKYLRELMSGEYFTELIIKALGRQQFTEKEVSDAGKFFLALVGGAFATEMRAIASASEKVSGSLELECEWSTIENQRNLAEGVSWLKQMGPEAGAVMFFNSFSRKHQRLPSKGELDQFLRETYNLTGKDSTRRVRKPVGLGGLPKRK